MKEHNEQHEECEATHEELCDYALEHYNHLANEYCHHNSTVHKAIQFYRENGSKAQQMAARKQENARTAKVSVKVIGKLHDIITQHAWADGKGRFTIEPENFENLQISLADYITPLLRKAGWFVDEDDDMLTCAATGYKENHVYLHFRTPEEQEDYIHIKLTEWQLKDRFNSDKMRVAIAALRLLETSDRLTLKAVQEIALKAMDDIAAIGNPELDTSCPTVTLRASKRA